MSWTWVWIGGALVLGFHLGVALMGLLVMSRDSRSDEGLGPHGPEGKSMLNGGRPVATAGLPVRASGFPETFGVEDPIPAKHVWEDDAKASGVR
jgi:hypothetical protein